MSDTRGASCSDEVLCSIVACWWGGRSDDAARTKQKSAPEVARAGFRASPQRAGCGGVLPGAPIVHSAFLLVEETTAGKFAGVDWWRRQVRRGEAGHGGVRVAGPRARAACVR